ncbi:MAG TPA: phosphotransferase [Mycobacteriales bacterium]|nr:phosphotransferase [Mycobacteriales bacterium]
MTRVPDGIAGLTADWLSEALGADVTGVEVTPVGTGQTGSSHRLAVTYGGPVALPATFVAKTGAEDPQVRQRVAHGYRAEFAFYERIAGTVDVPVPQVYAAALSDDATQIVLLMEDLAPAVQGDQIGGTTREVVLTGARALAGLHGPRWCDHTWKDLDVLTMPLATEDSAAGMGELVRLATDTFLATLGDRMSSADRDTLDAFPKAVPDWLMQTPERFALLHGDYRLDNLMLHPDGGIKVVDWQTLTVGLPGRDLAYWVTTSVSPAARRDVEAEAVSVYHAALAVDGYSLAACEEDYRAGQLHTLLIATLGWAFTTQTERGGRMMLAMVERACAAIRDLEVL